MLLFLFFFHVALSHSTSLVKPPILKHDLRYPRLAKNWTLRVTLNFCSPCFHLDFWDSRPVPIPQVMKCWRRIQGLPHAGLAFYQLSSICGLHSMGARQPPALGGSPLDSTALMCPARPGLPIWGLRSQTPLFTGRVTH